MRIKNEERWIVPTLEAASPIVDGFVILDDNSTDRTSEICRSFPKAIRFEAQTGATFDETRDKDRLLQMALDENPDWILSLDGDEVFEDAASIIIEREVACCPPEVTALAFKFLYMWDSHDRFRVDGRYQETYHTRMFRVREINQDPRSLRFRRTVFGGNFHCGSIPGNLRGMVQFVDVNVKHYGYFDRSIREAKRAFYERIDPIHAAKGYYNHLTDEEGMVLVPWLERDPAEAAYSDCSDHAVIRMTLKPASLMWRSGFFVSIARIGSLLKYAMTSAGAQDLWRRWKSHVRYAVPNIEKRGQ